MFVAGPQYGPRQFNRNSGCRRYRLYIHLQTVAAARITARIGARIHGGGTN
jgi:hypothetical protein